MLIKKIYSGRGRLIFLLLFFCLSSVASAGLVVDTQPGYARFIIKETVLTNSGVANASTFAAANGISLLGTGTSLFVASSTEKLQWQELANLPKQSVAVPSVSIWAEIDPLTNAVIQGRIDIFGDLLGVNGLQYGADLIEVVWGAEKLAFIEVNHSGNVCVLDFCSSGRELLLFKDINFNGDFSQSFQTTGKGIATVPLPASIWLLMSGVLGLIGFTRKKA